MRNSILFFTGVVLLLFCFTAILITGSVYISPGEVIHILFGNLDNDSYAPTIILETRLPMAVGAACTGAMLSCAGLMMQTLFHNPLAGPSVLGISSGASLGVALFMLGAGWLVSGVGGCLQPFLNTLSALAGGMVTIAFLYFFSSVLKSGVTLLVVGIMISYICTSGISLLNYFSPPDEIRSYLVWGLGNFNGLRLSSSIGLLIATIIFLIPTLFFSKPLNAMLLGERYLESVGFSMKKIRGSILLTTGLLVALPTAFCGPIGFIGLIVPHLCRLIFRTSNHLLLLPACMVFGALVTLFCAFLCVLPSAYFGLLPINVITPLIGVPVILYLLLNRSKLPYFS